MNQSLLVWDRPIPAAMISAVIFGSIYYTGRQPYGLSQYPYFNFLADAFLHNQLYLRLIPETTLDLSFFNGRYYLYWGPAPALLALPLVFLFGPQVSDVLQSILYGAFNVGLFSVFLRLLSEKEILQLTRAQRVLLTIFFSLGTPFTPLPAVGTVWFLLQLVSLMFVLLGFIAGYSLHGRKAFFWSGMAAAALLLSRPTAAPSFIFLAWNLLHRFWKIERKVLMGYCVAGLSPVAAGVGLILIYNYFRFGNPFENGLSYHLMGPAFQVLSAKHGQFSLQYVPTNLFYNYFFYPIDFADLTIHPYGGSLFLLSPLFFASFFTLWLERRDVNTWVLLLSILIGNIPMLLLMGPGVTHYGSRYAIDFFIPLFLLTAKGIKNIPFAMNCLLLLISIFHFLIGSIAFARVF